MIRQTHTYAILEVAESTFDDIKTRLEKVGVLDDYLSSDREDGELIVFHSTALKKEKTEIF